MRTIIYIILFFILFNFPVPIIYNSMFLGVIIASLLYSRNKGKNNDLLLLKKVIKTNQVLLIKKVFIGLILLSILWTIGHNTFDFSIIKGVLLCFLTVYSTIYVVPLIINHLFGNDDYLYEISRVLIFIFLAQSIIQIIAFIYPPFLEIITLFKKSKITRRDFQSIRSLALTGNPFFSLSSHVEDEEGRVASLEQF